MGACYSKLDEDTDDRHGKTRLANTKNVDYRLESVVAPNAGHQASSLRSLGNEMVIGDSSNNLTQANPTQCDPYNVVNRTYRPEPVVSTEVVHNNYGQGNSMASLGNPVLYTDYGQGNSKASLVGSSLEKPIYPQGNSMASLGRSIRYNDYGQGNSVANMSGSILKKPINPQGNNMTSLGGSMIEIPPQGNSMVNGSIRYNDHIQGNSMASLGGSILKKPQGNSMASLGGPILEKPINPQGNSMASLGGSILKKPINPQGNSMASLGPILEKPINPQGNSMASLGGSIQYRNYAQGNSMASLGGSILDNRINPMEPGATVVHNYVDRGTVNTSRSNLQKVGFQQDGSGVLTGSSGVLTGSFVQDGQLKEVYDNALGSMVFVLDENQPIDGLEPFVPIKTDTGRYYQSMSTIEQTGMVKEAVYGTQQGEDTAYMTQAGANSLSSSKFQSTTATDKSAVSLKIEDNRMQVKPMTRQNTDYQNAGSRVMTSMTRVYNQSGNMKPGGKNVYDPRIGEMVFVPNDKAQVDGQQTFEVNTRKAPEQPMQVLN